MQATDRQYANGSESASDGSIPPLQGGHGNAVSARDWRLRQLTNGDRTTGRGLGLYLSVCETLDGYCLAVCI